MALKNMFDRYNKRRRDAGVGLVDAVVGIGLAAVIIGGPVLYFTTINNAAAGAASTQGQNTAISEALDRAVANVQASDTIMYAGANELVTRSTEVEAGKADNPVINRWVVNGDKLYQQSWSGDAGVAAYDRSALPTAPAGSSTLNTRVSVDQLQLTGDLFAYTDKDGSALDVKAPKEALTETARTTPADGKKTYDIALVSMSIKAGTSSDGGKTGTVENKTSAAPRSVSGKADTAAAAAACSAVRVDTDAAGKPVITWNTLPGYTSYVVFRNATQIANVTAAASDSQKSFTDATVTPGPVEVINYRVQPRNADGTMAAIACTPKPWSPQIAAPVFKNSGVLPSAVQAHEWTDGADGALGLKKPRILLQWAAVPGATSYDLKYRELDPATGNPLTTAFNSAAAGLPAATTTFTWDDGGWGASYEWYVKANAGAGQGQSAESAHITTLTHPPAPQNIDITPQYGTGADRMTKGDNILTWSAAPTAVEYDIWRYNSGSTGAVTKLATVSASAARTYKDTVPYGTSWTYYVAAVNDGPRGTANGKASSASPEAGVTAATGTMPTVSYREPAGKASASTMLLAGNTTAIISAAVKQPDIQPAPIKATQLQFPPIPSGAPSRDYDGYNQLSWNPTLSATGYQVAKFDKTGTKTCITAECGSTNGGITTTTLKDTAAKGTQSDYAVIAYNATGLSIEFSLKETLTQRPDVPTMKVARDPSLTDSTAAFEVVQNADAGNTGASKFCSSATCDYVLYRSGKALLTTPHTQSGSTVKWTGGSPDGSTTTFTAKSKNVAVTNGGYSDPATVSVNTYPGTFAVMGQVGDANGGQVARYRLDVTNINLGSMSNGATTVRWSVPSGATRVDAVRRSIAGDTVSPDGDNSGLSRSAVRTASWNNGSSGVWDDLASPGAIFQYEVTATAPNGLKRTIKSQPVLTPADASKAGTMVTTCSGSDPRRFTPGQIGTITDTNSHTGSFFSGAYSSPYPNQVIGAKMVQSDAAHPQSLDGSPRYGLARGTDYLGLASWGSNISSPKNLYYTNWNNHLDGQWTSRNGDFASGQGVGYYQGLLNGFDVVTRGISFSLTNPDTGGLQQYVEPDSRYVTPMIEMWATYQNGCAPQGQTGHQLAEPGDACYAFDGTACQDNAYWNRPKWQTK
ncbi:fibronectin type III [Paeniglutamicibacter antarcticus]|uniref:Fibronectin type III n=1 Tax=Arthrobacter terrae TaxID=2935737 RepID=A0A931CPY3_9MICC|nr:fibronectin type III [Arthrobacter terrae]MBG0738856.1 fibronectin type III [Arthrobacter terrae]